MSERESREREKLPAATKPPARALDPFHPRLFSPKPRQPCRSRLPSPTTRTRGNVTPFSPDNRPDLVDAQLQSASLSRALAFAASRKARARAHAVPGVCTRRACDRGRPQQRLERHRERQGSSPTAAARGTTRRARATAFSRRVRRPYMRLQTSKRDDRAGGEREKAASGFRARAARPPRPGFLVAGPACRARAFETHARGTGLRHDALARPRSYRRIRGKGARAASPSSPLLVAVR